MVWADSFRFNVVARVVLIGALLYAGLWSVLRSGWDATPVVCAALLAVALVELVHYVETGTRDLTQLLRAVAAGDFTSALPRRWRPQPFAACQRASRELIDTYQRLDLQRAASDELLRAVIDHVGVAVLCFAGDGRVALANPEARRMLHLPAADGIPANLTRMAATDPLAARLLKLNDDERAQVEAHGHRGPAVLLLHARRFRLLDATFSVVVCHDIRRELEARDVQAWQSLARVLSHEMMNSLTPIVTLSGHLRDTLGHGDIPSRDALESVELIHERSSGLARFIEVYRKFAHPPTPVPTSPCLTVVVDRVARLLAPELQALGIQLDVSNEAPDARLHADADQLEQVLINVVRNARHALAGVAEGRIEIRGTRRGDNRVLIHVTDNGPGIAPAILDRIFLPFFTTRPGGSGIGLAFSRQLIELNGGSLSVLSEPGCCRFTLDLPGA